MFYKKSNLQVKTLLLLSAGSWSLHTQYSHCYTVFGVPIPSSLVRIEIDENERVPARYDALRADPKTIRPLDFTLQAKTA